MACRRGMGTGRLIERDQRRSVLGWPVPRRGRAVPPPLIPRDPLDREGLLGRGGPLVGMMGAAFLFLAVFDAGVPTLPWLTVMFGGLAVLAALVYFVPWYRLPREAQGVAPIAAVLLIAIARDAGGGPASGLAVLLVAPVVWAALYGTLGETIATLGAAIAVLIAPAALGEMFSGATYVADEEWRRIVAFALIGVFLAVVVARERRQGTTDALTGLANRRAWDEALCHALGRGRRTGEPVTVAIVDLDHFKKYNDLHGHGEGDRLLGDLACAWSARTRPADLVARIGGEEFAVLLLGSAAPEAVSVIDRLRGAVPHQTFSAGIASALPGERAEELMRRADDALYAAKLGGRDRTMLAAM